MQGALSRRRKKDEVGFQLAPMIDMTFLLLVFFMLTTKISKEQVKLDIKLPLASAAKNPDDAAGRDIVNIDRDGAVFLGDRAVTEDELEGALRKRFADRRFARIYLRADAGTDVRHVKRITALCARSGASEIIFATHRR